MRRGSRNINTSRNASGATTPSAVSSSNSTTPAGSRVGPTRGHSSMRIGSNVPPDVIRSTILSLVPQLRITEDKRRSLIVEIQQSDFNQSSVVEYFIGVVGVAQYEAALSEISKRPLAGVVAQADDPNSAQVTAGDKGKLLAKIYCHGGDVAFFGDIDLEFESQINKAFHGYSSSSQKKRRISLETLGGRHLPDLAFSKIEQSIKRVVTKHGRPYTFNPRFVASVQRCVSLMLMTILNLMSDLHRSSGNPSIDAEMVSVDSFLPNASKSRSDSIKLTHLLSAIQTLMGAERLPVNLVRDWEPLVIEKMVNLAQRQLGI